MRINLYPVLLLFLLIGLAGCKPRSSALDYPDEVYYRNAIMNKDKMSLASKRALEQNYDQGPEWFVEFKTDELKGDFAYEEGVTRRDPTRVITIDGKYYVYYSRATGETFGFGTGDPEKKVFPWDKTEVWYATSTDGWDWKEQGQAVGRGKAGSYVDRSVFTPEVLVHDG